MLQTSTTRMNKRVPHLRSTAAKVGSAPEAYRELRSCRAETHLNFVKVGHPVCSLTPECGVTLVELIVVISIIAILASAAVPLTRWQVKRTKEHELRAALWEMRGAIDKYKDAADRGAFQTKVDSFNYPPDLDTLINGVDVQTKKVKFLRRIPKDPMTNDTDWLLRSMQDDNDAQGWGGQNVFDVHSKSQGTALDGTKYSEW